MSKVTVGPEINTDIEIYYEDHGSGPSAPSAQFIAA